MNVLLHGGLVAQIVRQPRIADGHIAATPWLLLHHTGRIDRFASTREARDEALKTYSLRCVFSRT